MQINKNIIWLWFGTIIGLVLTGVESVPAQDAKSIRTAQESYELGVESIELYQKEKNHLRNARHKKKVLSYREEALKQFEASYEAIPNHPGILYFLMLVHAERRSPEEAKKFAEKALRARPSLKPDFKNGTKKIKAWAEKELKRLKALTGNQDYLISAPPNVTVPNVTSWSWKKL